MYDDYKINLTGEIFSAFNEKFKNRNKDKYQKRIDNMLNKIDITLGIKFFREYVQSSIILGYCTYSGEDIKTIIETTEFENEIFVYFLYKIALEIYEVENVKLFLRIFRDPYFFRKKRYFDGVVQIHTVLNKGGTEEYINFLDSIANNTSIEFFSMHGKVKKKTAYLLNFKKRNNFYWNTNDDDVCENIKRLEKNQKKIVKCPLCGTSKEVNFYNKSEIFNLRNNKIYFSCMHEDTKYISEKEVFITIKELKKYKLLEKKIELVDFVLFNWKYFSKKWREKNKNE